MATTKGPAISTDAAGTIADVLTFQKWKGRLYVRSKPAPRDPRTGPQLGTRAMFAFLSKSWADLAAGSKATYADLASAADISPFNAYLRHNQDRWTTGKAPSQSYPAAEDDTPAAIAFASSSVSGRRVTFTVYPQTTNQNWTLLIYRSTSTGFSPSIANCIGVDPWPALAAHYHTDTGMQPGTYYYRFGTSSIAGTPVSIKATQYTVVIP